MNNRKLKLLPDSAGSRSADSTITITGQWPLDGQLDDQTGQRILINKIQPKKKLNS